MILKGLLTINPANRIQPKQVIELLSSQDFQWISIYLYIIFWLSLHTHLRALHKLFELAKTKITLNYFSDEFMLQLHLSDIDIL